MSKFIAKDSVIMSKDEFNNLEEQIKIKLMNEFHNTIMELKLQYQNKIKNMNKEMEEFYKKEYFSKGYIQGFKDCTNELKELSEMYE